eukprot:559451-Amphidinium_carterae.1
MKVMRLGPVGITEEIGTCKQSTINREEHNAHQYRSRHNRILVVGSVFSDQVHAAMITDSKTSESRVTVPENEQ